MGTGCKGQQANDQPRSYVIQPLNVLQPQFPVYKMGIVFPLLGLLGGLNDLTCFSWVFLFVRNSVIQGTSSNWSGGRETIIKIPVKPRKYRSKPKVKFHYNRWGAKQAASQRKSRNNCPARSPGGWNQKDLQKPEHFSGSQLWEL